MAKVMHNNFTMGLGDKYRNLVFRQMKDGRIILASASDFGLCYRVPHKRSSPVDKLLYLKYRFQLANTCRK